VTVLPMGEEIVATLTDEQLQGIMKRYEERLFAGSSGQQAAKPEKEEPQEEKRWGWSYQEPEPEEPKRKLTFREWLDGGMKGECK
jgi:hypothetical protein